MFRFVLLWACVNGLVYMWVSRYCAAACNSVTLFPSLSLSLSLTGLFTGNIQVMDYNRMNANQSWYSYNSVASHWDQLHRMLSPIVPYSEYTLSFFFLSLLLIWKGAAQLDLFYSGLCLSQWTCPQIINSRGARFLARYQWGNIPPELTESVWASGNIKHKVLTPSECFIAGRKTQLGDGRETEGGWRSDGLSNRDPCASASVVLPLQRRSSHHTSCLLLSLLPPLLSLYSLQFWPYTWRFQFYAPPTTFVESSARNFQVCKSACGCLHGFSLRTLFLHFFFQTF